jgi:hypothetical protein
MDKYIEQLLEMMLEGYKNRPESEKFADTDEGHLPKEFCDCKDKEN